MVKQNLHFAYIALTRQMETLKVWLITLYLYQILFCFKISGKGQDKQGEFVIHGKEYEDGKVEFIKDYIDKSHTGILYEGMSDGYTVKGIYKFTYKTFLINMNIQEDFSMTVAIPVRGWAASIVYTTF